MVVEPPNISIATVTKAVAKVESGDRMEALAIDGQVVPFVKGGLATEGGEEWETEEVEEEVVEEDVGERNIAVALAIEPVLLEQEEAGML